MHILCVLNIITRFVFLYLFILLQGRAILNYFSTIWNSHYWSICVWFTIHVSTASVCMSVNQLLFLFRPPPMAVCRQCPTYRGGLSSLCSGASVAYTCPTPASHVMCRCCLQFMPLRPLSDDVPPQKCVLCEKYYCNAYWQSGCSGMACRGGGCLLPLKGV